MNQMRFFLCFAALLILLARNGAESISDKHATCIETCPVVSTSPVCGTDYVTYGSNCHLNCQKDEDKKTQKVSDGKCPKPPHCDCSNNWAYRSVRNYLCSMEDEFCPHQCAAFCLSAIISHKTKTTC